MLLILIHLGQAMDQLSRTIYNDLTLTRELQNIGLQPRHFRVGYLNQTNPLCQAEIIQNTD